MAKDEVTGRAKGGIARAEILSPETRTEIAQKAAQARWSKNLPAATHTGTLMLGGSEIPCAVLEDGTRLLTQAGFLGALGRSTKPKGRSQQVADGLPPFLNTLSLKPLITQEIIDATVPVIFRTVAGAKALGYRAELLPKVCNLFLTARDRKLLTKQQQEICAKCDMLVRGLAEVGIVALVDEATGYQEVRDKMALQAILDKFLRKELAAWAKRFPNEFYRQIFRLRGWEWKGMKVNRPQVVANYTNDFVWSRITPGLLTELEERMPKDSKGRNKGRYPQLLTEDVGDPALAQHLHAVVALMTAARNWDEFKRMLNVVFPKKGANLEFNFVTETD